MFTRLHHVALAVRTLERALGFFRDVLLIPVGRRATIADQGVHAALLLMHDGEIELLEPADPVGGVARFLERRGEGIHHLSFETLDVSSAVEQAKAAGLPLIDQTPRPGLAGMIAFLHPKASHGVLIELAQPFARSAHLEPASVDAQAFGMGTVYLAVNDLAVGAATYERHFGGKADAVRKDARFGADKIAVSIGSSRLALLSPTDAASPLTRFLAVRGEGLFGMELKVRDFERALRRLEHAGVLVDVRGMGTSEPLACLEPNQVHGVNLFLSPGPSISRPHAQPA